METDVAPPQVVQNHHDLPSSAQLGSVLGSWGNTTRGAVSNKERWGRRRTPTQDPSTYLAAQSRSPAVDKLLHMGKDAANQARAAKLKDLRLRLTAANADVKTLKHRRVVARPPL